MSDEKGVGLKGWLSGPGRKHPQSETAPTIALDQHRIAVLPFVSMSTDPQDEFFADGLTEELIDRLCQARDLEVIARTSVMTYKKSQKKAAEIGRELSAGALVEGSVRKAGNKIRVTAQLVNANTEAHVWSSKYDKELEDIFAVQSDIAQQVTDSLRIQLLPSEKKAIEKKATDNMNAYTMYLKGRYYWNERTEASVKRAIEYLKKAIEQDPGFAPAYSDLADCYVIMQDYSVMDAREASSLISKYATKALELDPGLSQPHASIAIIRERSYKWAEANRELERAIELNPNNATAHHWYALNLYFRGKDQEAIREWEKAKELDPLSATVIVVLAHALVRVGREKEGLEMMRDAMEINNEFPLAIRVLCAIYLRVGKLTEAAEEARRLLSLNAGLNYEANAASILAITGHKDEATRILEKLLKEAKTRYVDPSIIAMIYAGLGDEPRALEWLEQGIRETSAGVPYATILPVFDKIRNNPRFKKDMQAIGL